MFEKASLDMNQQNRDAYVNRIHGLVKVYLSLIPSEDAVSQHFRNKVSKDDSDTEDNRSDNEIKRDYKDSLLLELQSMRIDAMQNNNDSQLLNLSYISDATIKAFVDQGENNHLFYFMRHMAIQLLIIPSAQATQVPILRRMFEKEDHDWERVKQEAEELKEGEVHPEVLFLADVLTLPIFENAENTPGKIPAPFDILYRNILAIPQKILRGNAALKVLGHYAISKPNEQKQYYKKMYTLLQKFRLQNNFDLELLENHIQTTIALNFFIDQQYEFERKVNSD